MCGCVLPRVDACQEEAGLGPGGLDPVEVFNTLPEALQDAFESQVRPRSSRHTVRSSSELRCAHQSAARHKMRLWPPLVRSHLTRPSHTACLCAPLGLLARARFLYVCLFARLPACLLACLPACLLARLPLFACARQDTERLKAAIAGMPIEEAKYHMKRCEDSGLWVPQKD